MAGCHLGPVGFGCAIAPPNKRLQLTAAVGGVRRPWPAAVGPGVGRANGVRSVLGWFTRGRS
jgi:hypothetical protein